MKPEDYYADEWIELEEMMLHDGCFFMTPEEYAEHLKHESGYYDRLEETVNNGKSKDTC